MNRLDRIVLGLALLLLAVGAAMSEGSPADEVGPLIGRAVELGYFPCEWEDSPGPCYFDASVRGDKAGRDFVVTREGDVFYEPDWTQR